MKCGIYILQQLLLKEILDFAKWQGCSCLKKNECSHFWLCVQIDPRRLLSMVNGGNRMLQRHKQALYFNSKATHGCFYVQNKHSELEFWLTTPPRPIFPHSFPFIYPTRSSKKANWTLRFEENSQDFFLLREFQNIREGPDTCIYFFFFFFSFFLSQKDSKFNRC